MVKLAFSKTMLFRNTLRKKHFFVLFSFLLLSSFTLQAQTRIEGQVIDERTNTPLPGVTVMIKVTSEAVMTGTDGKFVLSTKAALPQTLTVSLTGYRTVEVRVSDVRNLLFVGMTEEVNLLNEVVVTAYGSQRRANITSAVSSLRSEEMRNIPAASLEGAMSGKLAGVQITSSSGTPGQASAIRIRGVGSLSTGNDPLWVVDGMPINTTNQSLVASGAQGASISMIADVNPADIESIEILKDASAAALYGSRASNGVILVTTKRGRIQRAKVSFNAYTGIQDMWKKVEFLDSKEWLNAMNEAVDNYNTSLNLTQGDAAYKAHYEPFDPNPDPIPGQPLLPKKVFNTNWFDEVTRSNAKQTSIQLSVAGGNDKTRYYISGGYFDQEGIEKITRYKRYSLRSNLDQVINKRIKLSADIGLTYANHDRVFSDNNIYSAWTEATKARPDYPVYDEDGNFTFTNNVGRNPVRVLLEPKLRAQLYRALINLKGTVNIMEGLNYNVTLGEDLSLTDDKRIYPLGSLMNAVGEAEVARTLVFNHLIEHTLTYTRTFNKLNIGALAGYSYQYRELHYNNTRGTGFGFKELQMASSGSTRIGGETLTQSALQSLFGRINLGYDDRYLLEASLRRDASSKFSPENRVGYFPAGSLGWRVSNEAFFPENKVVTDLKFRGSAGLTGNQEGIGAYGAYSIYSVGSNYNDVPGVGFSIDLYNPDLTWEKTFQYGFGVDMGLFDGRMSLMFDWFKKDTRDLLFDHTISSILGSSWLMENVGSLTNQGIEISLTSNNLTGALKWNTSFNISFVKNEITGLVKDKLGNNTTIDAFLVHRLAVGQPVGAFYLVKALGVYQSEEEIRSDGQLGQNLWDQGIRPGDMKYYDKNGDNQITPDDRMFMGGPAPKFYGSLINSFTYKGVDLGIDLQFSYGNQMYAYWKTGSYAGHMGGADYAISQSEWDNRWTPQNHSNTTPRAVASGTAASHNSPGGTALPTSRYLEDASFLRIKNITLGYEIPTDLLRKIDVERVRLYFTVGNLYTFTKYSGFDPEILSNPSNATWEGVDLGIVPQLRSFIFGINISF